MIKTEVSENVLGMIWGLGEIQANLTIARTSLLYIACLKKTARPFEFKGSSGAIFSQLATH